ncbi:hypothetical protein HBH53_201220 [Parastagonospora nodorum]|nr:hypothetical protein HBH53_201220 [Parastagonospora nodorum]KAH5400120.1 hypothetical protein HBI46_236250 [Parastagonospora nodorum]
MHLPGTKKSEKRKASVVSLGDEAPVEKKEVKREKKKKAKSNQRKGEKIAAKSMTPDPQPQASSPIIVDSSTIPPTMSSSDRVDSVTESPPNTTLAHAHTEPTPRRSSRIKNSLHSVAQTWDKARPYIERINGTIMPLEPQAGAEVYYKRDGVK